MMDQRVSLQEHRMRVVPGEVVEGVMPPRPRRNTLTSPQNSVISSLASYSPHHSQQTSPVLPPRKPSTSSFNECYSPSTSPTRSPFTFPSLTVGAPSHCTSFHRPIHSSPIKIPSASPLRLDEVNSFPDITLIAATPPFCQQQHSFRTSIAEEGPHCSPRDRLPEFSKHLPSLSNTMATLLQQQSYPTYQPLYAPIHSYMEEFSDLIFNPASSHCVMHFIMPNGVLIILKVPTQASLAEIKADLWEKAREYPLYGLLHDMTKYHFTTSAVTSPTTKVYKPSWADELLDEDWTLREVSPFLTFLKVIERKGNEAEKILNKDIGNLIGKNLSDFVALKNPEVNEFRWKMKTLCDEAVKERIGRPWYKRVQYKYPCSLDRHPSKPKYLEDKLKKTNEKHILVSVRFSFAVRSVESMFTLRVEHDVLPNRLMEQALNKFNTLESSRQTLTPFNKANYIFKTVGREEYFAEEVALYRYITVQQHLANREQHPLQLMVVERSTIDVDEDEHMYEVVGSDTNSTCGSVRNSFSTMTLSKKKSLNVVSSWTVSEQFRIEMGSITKLNLIGQGSIRVIGGLYHGTLPLCQKQQTDLLSVKNESVDIDKSLTFDIAVCNLPRSTRLCLAIFEEIPTQQKSGKKSTTAPLQDTRGVAWVNISVFDYRRGLRRGAMTLYCWAVHDVDLPKPLGTVVSNPDHDGAIAFTVTFPRYHSTCDLMYPAQDTLLDLAAEQPQEQVTPTIEDNELISRVAGAALRDPTGEMFEQDKRRLWNLRWYCCRQHPHILPRLLECCVDWNNKEQVSQVSELLSKWPKIKPSYALELLDYNFAEPVVRDYAVECISSVSDEDLMLYLLQLTQALKHENHLHCTLAEFLLQRALNNTKIGHFLFWHLRSEMHVPSVSIRFGLLLEAYCKGAQEHMKLLTRQLEALNKFRELRERGLKLKSSKARDALQEIIKTQEMQATCSNVRNMLDPTQNLSSIRAEFCRSMDSKMAPLWLVFESEEDESVSLLYKRGDDLRQDMLTLQTIRIMDKLWKKHGWDFKMNPYRCISTTRDEGLIEGVRNATTIANIQRDKGMLAVTCPFRKGSLLEWLREKNPTEASLNKAVSEFTLSCAGYCVATYVLGIADRHSDNIMIMENGQLFHIDFGHILGHFKTKFGIKREHQPFVLTHDFIYVITKGSTGSSKQSDEFENFKQYCEEAYQILRRYGNFIISLFAMMISTGLPELQEERDLDYINERLQLSMSDEDALQHFRKEFGEAMKNSWKTSLHWAFHAMSKDNR